MATIELSREYVPLRLQMGPVIEMSDDQFFEFCHLNRGLRIERTSKGDLIIMTPAGGITSQRNSELVTQLHIWAKKDGTGVVFDSSGGFNLPNGATRSPDAAWIKRSRLAKLTIEEKEKFIPLCPDFAIELRSSSDRLRDIQDKMVEYIANGLQLGWLIDPQDRQVFVYTPPNQIDHLQNPSHLSGEPLLAGFRLDLADIWTVDF